MAVRYKKTSLNMSGIYKNLLRIYQVEFHAVFQYLCEDLLKKIGIFKTASIILPEGRKMRNRIHHIQTQKPRECETFSVKLTTIRSFYDKINIIRRAFYYGKTKETGSQS